MVIGVKVLISVLLVALVLVFKHVRREGLPGKNISAIPLVAENVVNGALTPVRVADFGFAADVGEYLLLGSEDLDFPQKRAEERPDLSDNEAKILALLQGLSEEGFLRIISYVEDMLKLYPKSYEEQKGDARAATVKKEVQSVSDMAIDPDDERKVGALVQASLAVLEESEFKFSNEQLNQMQTLEWSNTTFKLNYPLLKRVDESKPVTEQRRDHLGNGRYYSRVYTFSGMKFLVTSEWYAKSKPLFINWYNRLF